MIGFHGTYGYLGDHLHVGLGRPVSAGGLAALAYGVGFGAAAFLDRAIDRFGARRALPAAFVAVAATNASLAATSASYAALLAIVVVWDSSITSRSTRSSCASARSIRPGAARSWA